jgi:hypothetical protein
MKNKICLVLPYYGPFHAYFNLFLHSVGRNKDFFDLLLVTDHPVPDLPSNVYNKIYSVDEVGKRITAAIKDWFSVDVATPFPEGKMSNGRPALYKLCDYKFLYGDVFAEELQSYPYWGFVDCDLIFGDASKFLQDFEQYDFIGNRGHLCFLKKGDKAKNILLDVSNWPNHPNYMPSRLKEAKESIPKTRDQHLLDEGWFQCTLKMYAGLYPDKFKYFYTAYSGIVADTYHPGAENKLYFDKLQARFEFPEKLPNGVAQTTFKNFEEQYFAYLDGRVFRKSFANAYDSCEHLYVHLIGRTSYASNNVGFKDYDSKLNFTIKPILTFDKIEEDYEI